MDEIPDKSYVFSLVVSFKVLKSPAESKTITSDSCVVYDFSLSPTWACLFGSLGREREKWKGRERRQRERGKEYVCVGG